MISFIKDVLSVVVSKFAIIIFGLTTSIVLARVLGPEKNGIIAALMVYPSLFMSIGSLGVRQSTTYFLGKRIFAENQIKKAITQIWFLTSIISVFVCYFLMTQLSKSGDHKILVLLALIPIPFALFNTYNSGIFLGKNQIKEFNKVNWIPPLITLVLTLVLVIICALGIKGYFIAIIGGSMFISILLLFKNKFIRSFNLKFDWRVILPMIKLGSVYAIALLFIGLNAKLDIIILDWVSTDYETGIYSKGYSVGNYLLQIPWMLNTIVFTRSAISKDGIEFSKRVCQLLRITSLVILFLAIVLFLLSDFIIVFMFGEEFKESAMVLNYLLFGVLFLTLFKILNQDLAGKGKPWVSMKAMIPGLIVNVILNIVLIPKYGAIGAAFASSLSYCLAIVLFFHFYSLSSKISLKEMFSYKKSDFDPIISMLKKIKFYSKE
ncbi:flippase [uncultured Winogradskyella sp.]|uniref:flippase n=1 Tax=uncultured Winogradskyella sp. TaxID=395353 RepID=UPI002607AE54|nr:flippase [uncultured Winogradskyella sp.]